MKAELTEKFSALYGQEPKANYFTPGRVNLIGEHIDYNGGLVMPCAVTLGTWLSIAPNNDQVIRFKSLNFPEEQEIPLQDAYTKTGPNGTITLWEFSMKSLKNIKSLPDWICYFMAIFRSDQASPLLLLLKWRWLMH